MKKLKKPKLFAKKQFKQPKLGRLKLKLPKKLPLSLPGKAEKPDAKLVEAIQNLPRITNETVAEHREEVLSSARKYIYPLSHSRRRIVLITSSLFLTVVVGFFIFCVVSLYRLQTTSTFMYGVTQVVPFPVAKAGGSWVSYQSYLFELRHTVHYYQTQQHETFSGKSGKRLMATLKQQALQQVIDNAYVKQLAKQHHVSVSSREVNQEVNLLRTQNRLGSNDQVFRDVLNEFWGWTPDDFRQQLRQQLLAQKVTAALDTTASSRAQVALVQLRTGTDFATLAKQVSDNTSTKVNGGDYGILIDRSNRDFAPQVVAALFALKQPGQITDIISTSNSLEIDKLTAVTGNKIRASQIVFGLKPISTYIAPLTAKQPSHRYITIVQPS